MANILENMTAHLSRFVADLVSSPINLALTAVCGLLLYKIFVRRHYAPKTVIRESELPRMKKQDLTLEQLREYDGTKEPEKRILLAVEGKVFDVTKGRHFYGQGGPYASFAGRDATRALATFAIGDIVDGYDDLSDLNTMQMESVKEWVMQFSEKYDYVGRLLKPGEEPAEYSDEEDQSSPPDSVKEDAQKKGK
ncbi:hypothetical protein CHUAL_001545 [Chamberlinius hualienensis]